MAVTLNDWDRPARVCGERGKQRCYRRRDKWKTIDVSWMMWEKIKREEEGSETGY